MGWADHRWGNSLLDFWDDLLDDGLLERASATAARPIASLVGTVTLPPGESADLTFLMTWNFPHRRAWRSEEYGGINVGEYTDEVVGNAYAVALPDSWQTAPEVPSGSTSSSRSPSTRSARWWRSMRRGRSSRRLCSTSARCAVRRCSRPPTAVLRLGRGRRRHRQLLRHVHARVGVRVRDVAALRADLAVLPTHPVRPLHRRPGADELPHRPAASSSRGPGRSPPRTGRWPVWCTCIWTGGSAATTRC